MNTHVFTCGDINGIGPEICIKTINKIFSPNNRKIIFVCPANVFENTASVSVPDFPYEIVRRASVKTNAGTVQILDIGAVRQTLGKPTSASGEASYRALIEAFLLNKQGIGDSMITGPISKAGFILAGRHFPGQTELLARLSKTDDYLMMFLSEVMICALTTIHVPIKKVPAIITKEKIVKAVKIINKTMTGDLGRKPNKIAVLALNPHAGENGTIGDEEVRLIRPAIKSIKKIPCEGPFVPDAFFGNKLYERFDAVLGMYHDQVLIPFKMLNFSTGVNYTAGLSIVRTSPDHGTGYDIAGKGVADSSSMCEAVKWADLIINNRRGGEIAG
jgi:4-hydroxythreonine-4-phosphate dehydrogenase